MITTAPYTPGRSPVARMSQVAREMILYDTANNLTHTTYYNHFCCKNGIRNFQIGKSLRPGTGTNQL